MNCNILATAVLMGLTVIAKAEEPVPPPDIYNQGPASPMVASTDISAAERAAYALLESTMQMAEARIGATNCALSSGIFDVYIYSDGSNDPDYNVVVVVSPGSTFTLRATINPWDSFWGQSMVINQQGGGGLKQVALSNFYAKATYNAKGTIMEMDSNINVIGNSGRFNAIKGKVIKDFNLVTDDLTGLPYIVDWGAQSISKLGYPIQQYWQRSKVIRDDGLPGRTVFVKDRTTGPTSCRIVIDTQDYNNQDFFYQTGTMTISTSTPGSPVNEFDF